MLFLFQYPANQFLNTWIDGGCPVDKTLWCPVGNKLVGACQVLFFSCVVIRLQVSSVRCNPVVFVIDLNTTACKQQLYFFTDVLERDTVVMLVFA